ncbi:MAG TPA: hypothetical protein VHM70_24845 [Polyangiaceae bacterium]|jgi:hypothetical protein|nr:hypothetical protein [Polyangiaceae bacterium]
MRKIALLGLGLLGCLATPRGGQESTARASAPAELAPLALSDSGPLPTELASDMAWQLAERGDPMYLGVLARRSSTAELEARIIGGGRAGAVALDAFEFAPDAYPEHVRLCSLVPRLRPPHRQRALCALARILGAGDDIHFEPSGSSTPNACGDALRSVDGKDLSDEERDILGHVLSQTSAP